MRWAVVIALGASVACDARLGPITSSNPDGNGTSGDGNNGGNGDSSSDAAPLCATGRVVYLEFEGATITQVATASDSLTNKAVWMGVGSATLPKFRNGVADRLTQIADVTNLIKTKLAPYPEIKVVTARPAAGPYVMIGFGGVHQTVNVPYLYAVNRLDCGDTATKNDLAWVFEDTPTVQKVADVAVGSILFGLGATGTNNVDDCMCGWLTACQSSNNSCTISSSITAVLQCPNQTNPQDETAILHTFCQ